MKRNSMNSTIKAITEQQIQTALKTKDSNNYKQHMEDIDVISNLTMIKIAIKNYE